MVQEVDSTKSTTEVFENVKGILNNFDTNGDIWNDLILFYVFLNVFSFFLNFWNINGNLITKLISTQQFIN